MKVTSPGLKYLTADLSKLWSIDIEGDLIPSTVIWCLCAVKLDTKEEVRLRTSKSIREWIDARKKEGCRFVGHNIIGYDAPTLNRLLGTSLTIADLVDTLVMSMVWVLGVFVLNIRREITLTSRSGLKSRKTTA